MNYIINGREPEAVFRFFEEICAIPHPSFHEERVADYLVAFAKERGLECVRDELHNVLIKKPATKGMEHRAAILFQGHTDMVCEKNGDVAHDFMKDPLKLFLDGDLLGAEGTTLGGDDGIAVAMMLALLDGEIPEHPAIECLFTVAEEVGLNGAHGFDYSHIQARTMVNLDSEDLGVITAGCAGGLRTDLTLAYEEIPMAGEALRVSVTGLAGGHSGVDICTGRANANKLMGRVLARLCKEQRVHLISLEGGSKDNAIPRECVAVLAVSNVEDAKVILATEAARIRAELVAEDTGFTVCAEKTEAPMTMLSDLDTLRAVTLLATVDNGVKEMNRNVKGLPEWSRNLGVIRTENGKMEFIFSVRSAIESRLDASIDELDTFARMLGCTAKHYSRYPGWDYAPVSPVREAYLNAYREVMGKEARVDVIHAGLECGIIYSKLPDMDIISIGPDMKDIHSPSERLNLASVELFWRTLEKLIAIL